MVNIFIYTFHVVRDEGLDPLNPLRATDLYRWYTLSQIRSTSYAVTDFRLVRSCHTPRLNQLTFVISFRFTAENCLSKMLGGCWNKKVTHLFFPYYREPGREPRFALQLPGISNDGLSAYTTKYSL